TIIGRWPLLCTANAQISVVKSGQAIPDSIRSCKTEVQLQYREPSMGSTLSPRTRSFNRPAI
ncbi:hypothetical protein, partial [Nocardiopsis kunsanensis]|uniref:hypothetical protein n=1 Tax=Nocardiopsis kunsanensis TaxID=141693 RepID=UPI001E4E4A5E